MAEIWNRAIWRIINSQNTSTGRTRDGKRIVRSGTFKPLPISKQEEINQIIEQRQLDSVRKVLGSDYDTLAKVKERSAKILPAVYNPGAVTQTITRVKDGLYTRDIGPYAGSGGGGVGNLSTQAGVYGQDPALNNRVTPNIWISPMEAAAIFSQKGIPETIIRKKSQSILLNGVKIKNPMLTPEQNDKLAESMIRTGVAHKIADVLRDSLCQGGGLMYPVFKKDTPMSMGLPVATLAKYGIVGKGCIDYYVTLDRWNVVHIPTWDPTQKDFLNPDVYYIPFLGSDVKGERCSRVVTAPQAGYWGNLMTLGWGISDIPGWIESVYNYYNVMSSVPNMINQMSLLVRSFNVEGVAALEGADVMDMVDKNETMRVRQSSANNPINMDVIGELKAIERDFKQVPELIRLIRQDAAAKANIPEELLWSSERGAFASGDSNDSAYEKQSEGTRYIHIDVANQLKHVAQLEIINALGLDRDVLRALPYTKIQFDNPRVTNARDKAEIAAHITKGLFDMVAGGIPLDAALDISRQFSDDEFAISNELMGQLRERQSLKDKREQEKHNKEIELMDAQIEGAKAGQAAPGGKPAKPKGSGDKDKKGHSYSDPLKQREHEKIGSKGKQGLQKARSKEVI